MAAKIQIKNDSVRNFGGFFSFVDHFRNDGLDIIVDKALGNRSMLAKYSNSDIFLSLVAIYLTGGSCIEDSNRLSRNFTEISQGYRFCSADTILRMIKAAKSDNEGFVSKAGAKYQFSINQGLCGMLLDGMLKTGQVTEGEEHVFDYDNQFIPAEKYDAKYSYKGAFGYFPGIAQIDGLPFYIEGRDGNANVKFQQGETLRRAFELAAGRGVSFRKARMDCGSYSEEVVRVVGENCKEFYIRAMSCDSLRERIRGLEESDWTDAEINHQKCQLASVPFTAFLEDKGYRLVVQRTLREDGQTDVFEGKYVYRSILTNDHDSSLLDVVLFYNQRAGTERCFDSMNNDFGWGHLPCSFLAENTAFMIMTAFIHNYYRHFIEKLAALDFGLSKASRVKRFVFSFVSVPFKWVVRNSRKVLLLYTENADYMKLQV